MLADDPRLLNELVPYLARRGLAALAIQTGYYLDEIPHQLVRQCNRYGLPLLELPKSAGFADITKAILKKVVNRQMEMLEYAQRMHSRLTQVVLQNEGLPQIARVLSELLDAPIRIFDRYFNLLTYFGLPDDSCLLNPQTIRLEHQVFKKNSLQRSPQDIKSPQFIAADCNSSVPGQVLQPLKEILRSMAGAFTCSPFQDGYSVRQSKQDGLEALSHPFGTAWQVYYQRLPANASNCPA